MQSAPLLLSCESDVADKGCWTNLKETLHQVVEELTAPPTISAVRFCIINNNILFSEEKKRLSTTLAT